MERRLKERLTGAVVLVVLAVIFIPMILDNSAHNDMEITVTNIPAAPDIEFRDEILPVEDTLPLEPPTVAVEPAPLPPGQTDVPITDTTTTVTSAGVTEVENGTGTAPDSTAPEAPEASVQATDPPAPSVSPPTDDNRRNLSAWVIQLGSFSSRQNAESLIKQLQTNGFPGYIEPVKSGTETVYKVRVGPELSRSQAETIQKNLKSSMNIDAIILRFP